MNQNRHLQTLGACAQSLAGPSSPALIFAAQLRERFTNNPARYVHLPFHSLQDSGKFCVGCYESLFCNSCSTCGQIISTDSRVRLSVLLCCWNAEKSYLFRRHLLKDIFVCLEGLGQPSVYLKRSRKDMHT